MEAWEKALDAEERYQIAAKFREAGINYLDAIAAHGKDSPQAEAANQELLKWRDKYNLTKK